MPQAISRFALPWLLFLLSPHEGASDHPCDAEVMSACPERPGSEMADCLKSPSEHESPTTISSECTDFIALNVACRTMIEKYCDDAFFSRDTVLCLTEWTNQDDIDSKCAGVMKWAIPKKDGEEKVVTDELGMSEADYAEKKAWQAKRKAARTASIEKMRESDAAKEKERKRLEKLKQESPEEYELEMKELEERKKNLEAMKKRERLMEAARQRRAREEAGLPPVDEEEEKRSRRRSTSSSSKSTWCSRCQAALDSTSCPDEAFGLLSLRTPVPGFLPRIGE